MATSKYNKRNNKPPGPDSPNYTGIIADPERKQPGSRRKFHAKFDWEKIEQDYIYNDISYAELARAIGCSVNTIYTHAKRGDWTKKKERVGDERRARVKETVLEQQTADGVRAIQNIQNITERITMMLADVFADEKQFRLLLLLCPLRARRWRLQGSAAPPPPSFPPCFFLLRL